MADDPTVPAAPAAAVPAGVTPPSATAATTTASASAAPVVPAQAAKQDTESTATVTERGWDGWPTAPTPDYLIPRMGAIPVASTVHFQTVAMTGVDDALSPAAMWARLRMPLVEVSQRKSDEASNRRLVVTKAAYGDLGTEGVADVTRLLQARVHAGKLSLAVTSDNLGLDPAPGIHKSLSVEYLFDGAAAAVIVDDNQSLDIGAEPPRIDATSLYRKYLQPAPGSVADVADRLSRDG
ncbi:MAG: DUF3395 domain-containing protein, partial [Gammaproteobacteria bacterium]|nr:DUF3395 domain-containing protein [Gammaproteobacteria bacterium]